MVLKSKAFVVTGDVSHRDLNVYVENQVNSWLSANPGINMENVAVAFDSSNPYGKALITVFYRESEAKSEPREVEKATPGLGKKKSLKGG